MLLSLSPNNLNFLNTWLELSKVKETSRTEAITADQVTSSGRDEAARSNRKTGHLCIMYYVLCWLCVCSRKSQVKAQQTAIVHSYQPQQHGVN